MVVNMTNRELFHATMAGENGDDLLHMELSFDVQDEKWFKEGLSDTIEPCGFPTFTKHTNYFDYIQVSGFKFVNFDQFCLPKFDEKTISIIGDRKISIDGNGATWQSRTDSDRGMGRGSIPHEIDFTFKTPEAYLENRYRLTENTDKRVDYNYLEENSKLMVNQDDYIISLWAHGPFAYLRALMGTENAMVMPYYEPNMIKMMLEDHLEKCKKAAEPVIKSLKPDVSYVWEDCCGSTGPFITPNIFQEFMAPWYKGWKDYLNQMGVKWIVLDTDGDPSPLVKLWYESGVDLMLPWEVNGIDMLKFADEYKEYCMWGGIYKHIFEPNHPAQVGKFDGLDLYQAIDRELERVLPKMKKRGRYFPALDHSVHSNVTYKGFEYYNRMMQEKYGTAMLSTRK